MLKVPSVFSRRPREAKEGGTQPITALSEPWSCCIVHSTADDCLSLPIDINVYIRRLTECNIHTLRAY